MNHTLAKYDTLRVYELMILNLFQQNLFLYL
jgi:hypothetical protein